jgi:hypothetical protein
LLKQFKSSTKKPLLDWADPLKETSLKGDNQDQNANDVEQAHGEIQQHAGKQL